MVDRYIYPSTFTRDAESTDVREHAVGETDRKCLISNADHKQRTYSVGITSDDMITSNCWAEISTFRHRKAFLL